MDYAAEKSKRIHSTVIDNYTQFKWTNSINKTPLPPIKNKIDLYSVINNDDMLYYYYDIVASCSCILQDGRKRRRTAIFENLNILYTLQQFIKLHAYCVPVLWLQAAGEVEER